MLNSGEKYDLSNIEGIKVVIYNDRPPLDLYQAVGSKDGEYGISFISM